MKKPNILVVEDEESIRFTFEQFLLAEGYAVALAEDFQQAITQLDNFEFDVIFADILLGRQTGIDLLREIKRRGLLCPVILITGAPEVDTAAEAVRLGAYDYIPKPITRSILQRISRMALTLRKLELEKEKYRLNLEAVFNSLRDGIVTVDPQLRIVTLNAAARVAGLSRQDLGRLLDEPVFECSPAWLSGLRQVMRTPNRVELQRLEHLIKGQQGEVFSLTISPLLDSRGRQAGAVTVIRDDSQIERLKRCLDDGRGRHSLIGSSRPMQQVFSLIDALAAVDTTVLITGESGTGKELVAEAIHRGGSRRDHPLIKVNCTALMDNLLESELFGHARGAFTGAVEERVGRFQKADGGTIFLDEIGDISPALQAKLLRVLQEKEFERVGESSPIRVDVRIIAATNRDLAAKVRRGEFREDLYYRLKVVEVRVPPLRERREDIPLLAEAFIGHFRHRFGKEISGLAPEVLDSFLAYSWPGNVRQLEHVIEYAFILCSGGLICEEHLPPELTEREAPGSEPADGIQALRQALARCGGNKAKAARLLGISRKTLYRQMERYGIADAEGYTSVTPH